MEHLYNSVVRVERLELTPVPGKRPAMTWVQATDEDPAINDLLQYLKCRIDMNFLRPGKDIPAAPEAGKAPDRMGLLITSAYAPLRAGDRVIAIPNERNKIPVPGTFYLKVIPDAAQDYDDQHHLEVQIIEESQYLSEANWPMEENLNDTTPAMPDADDELEELIP